MLLQWPKGFAGDFQALHYLPTSSSPQGSFHPCGGESNGCTIALHINDGRRNIKSGIFEPIVRPTCAVQPEQTRV